MSDAMLSAPTPAPMTPASGSGAPPRDRDGLASAAPLVLAYLLLPLCRSLALHAPALRPPEWIPSGWPWLALAGVGLCSALAASRRRAPARSFSRRWLPPVAGGVLLALGTVWWIAPRLQGPFFPNEQFWLLALPETAPLAFALLAGAWVLSFGAPGPRRFLNLGAILAGLVLADALLTSLLAGRALPGGLLLVPEGRGGRALLLGLALLVGLDDAERAGRFPRRRTLLLMAGVLCGGSSVVLLATGAGYLFLSRVRLEARIGFALACAGGVLAPLTAYNPAAMDSRMQLSMTWLAGWESFATHPLALLKGFGPWPLDLRLPEQTAGLLGLPDMSFTLPPRAVPAFWMRAALVWGAVPPGALFLVGVALTAVSPGRAMAGVMALGMVQGVVGPLLYDGPSAVAFCLAICCLLAQGARTLRRRVAAAAEASSMEASATKTPPASGAAPEA